MIKKINTIVDGYDVKVVNLWPSPSDRTRIIGKCVNDETVTILEYKGDYVKIRNTSGKIGWCNSGFLEFTFIPGSDKDDIDESDSDIAIDKPFFDKEKEHIAELKNNISRTWISRLVRKLRR